jgi:hypothetical protein
VTYALEKRRLIFAGHLVNEHPEGIFVDLSKKGAVQGSESRWVRIDSSWRSLERYTRTDDL